MVFWFHYMLQKGLWYNPFWNEHVMKSKHHCYYYGIILLADVGKKFILDEKVLDVTCYMLQEEGVRFVHK